MMVMGAAFVIVDEIRRRKKSLVRDAFKLRKTEHSGFDHLLPGEGEGEEKSDRRGCLDAIVFVGIVSPISLLLISKSSHCHLRFPIDLQPHEGDKALGSVVTNKSKKPELEEARCVRENLTDECETCGLLGEASSEFLKLRQGVWNTRPCRQAMLGRGVSVGTFFCSSVPSVREELHIRAGGSTGEPVNPTGSNLPGGGTNDGEHVDDWVHLTLCISNFTANFIAYTSHKVVANGLMLVSWGTYWGIKLPFTHLKVAMVATLRGTYIQGSERLRIGVRKNCAQSKFSLDSSVKYEVLMAEYLQGKVVEVCWLQFIREWGPTIVSDLRTELDKLKLFSAGIVQRGRIDGTKGEE
ncbi:hypothetical protein Nepgr_032754 [Nepenthes gracilis]|uniref:Uncharacterized protein n=1 Tax=Nepenthes gracilis TaxID=150966 RepID=A0AAD3TKP4_NEPGR|nr:hypothetical protein Nepgr_032754 [Nepenthes gracilis]